MAHVGSAASSDPALDEVETWFRSRPEYADRFRRCVRSAIDEIIDTARTGRYSLDEVNTQEKAYLGTKIEVVIRAEFDLPYPGRGKKDYLVEGHEVDCKWSIKWGGWEIPTEQYGHLCLLVHGRDESSEIAVGLIRTIAEYVNPGRNKDSKAGIAAAQRDAHTRWLIPRSATLPVNFLLHLPGIDREAILSQRGGVARAYELYRRCEGIIISRRVMEAVGQQRDDSRRYRGGRGGVRELLVIDGYEVLNGTWLKDRERAAELGGPVPSKGESVCLHVDGQSGTRSAGKSQADRPPLTLFPLAP